MKLGMAQARLLRLFSSAILVQALLSAASLMVGLLLIRNTPDADYGHYVLATTGLLLLTSLQGAFIGGPLSVLAPKREPAERLAMVSGIYSLQTRFTQRFAFCALACLAILTALGLLNAERAGLSLAFIIAAWMTLNREYLRQLLMIYSRPLQVLQADFIYVVVLIGLAALAVYFFEPAAPAAVAGLAVAAWLGARPALKYLQRDPGLALGDTGKFLAQLAPLGLWATAGAAVYWAFSQGYNYLVAWQLNVAAVAALAATRLFMMPINLLTGGVKQLLVPTAAGWLQAHGFAGVMRRVLLIIACVTFLALCYCGLLWLTRDWITETVLDKTIPDRDALVLIWMAVFLIQLVRDLLITVLFVREKFSSLTWLALLCAFVALGSGLLLMPLYGARGGVLGQLIGEVVNIIGVLLLLIYESRQAATTEKRTP